MEIIFGLITISLGVAVLFLLAFVWAVRSHQYDDTYTPAVRVLFEEPPQPEDKPGPAVRRQGSGA